MARGNGHLPTADVIDWAWGEDARVAGVYGMRGGKTPAAQAFMACEGGRRPRCGRLWHARGEDARVAGGIDWARA